MTWNNLWDYKLFSALEFNGVGQHDWSAGFIWQIKIWAKIVVKRWIPHIADTLYLKQQKMDPAGDLQFPPLQRTSLAVSKSLHYFYQLPKKVTVHAIKPCFNPWVGRNYGYMIADMILILYWWLSVLRHSKI